METAKRKESPAPLKETTSNSDKEYINPSDPKPKATSIDINRENDSKKDKPLRKDMHPLEILTYNETLIAARKNYPATQDSIKDWETSVRKNILEWIENNVDNDELNKKMQRRS